MGIQSIVMTSNRVSDSSDIYNGVRDPSYKWFSLHQNALDGSFHPMPSDASNEVGFWGNSISNADGTFPVAQSIDITYDALTSLHQLNLIGDSKLDHIVVDFDITLFRPAGDVVYSIRDNSSVYWMQNVNAIDVTRMKIDILKVNKSGVTAKVVDAMHENILNRNDILSLSTAETEVFYLYTGDSSIVSATQDEAVENTQSAVDLGAVHVEDASFFVQYEMATTDSGGFTTDETDIITVNIPQDDSLILATTENDVITASFNKSDNLSIDKLVEVDNIIANLYSSDKGSILLDEVSLMRNIHTVMDDDVRQVVGKVEITYSDPFRDDTVTYDSSPSQWFSAVKKTFNRRDTSPYKWFALSDNQLDGSYHPIPSEIDTYQGQWDPNAELFDGWWSYGGSDAQGFLLQPEWIRINFTQRTLTNLKVTGDDKLKEFPVDFVVKIFDSYGTEIYRETVIGNQNIRWEKTVSVPEAVAIEYEFQKVNKPYASVKVLELFTSVVEVYEANDISYIDLLEEQIFDDLSLPIGNVSSNELVIQLKNSNGRFDPTNTLSPLAGLMKRNRRVRAWLGAEIVPGEVEWYQLGTFWTMDWHAPQSGLEVTIKARDRMQLLAEQEYALPFLNDETTVYQAAKNVLERSGLNPTEYVIDPRFEDVSIGYHSMVGLTYTACLQKLSIIAMARVFCDRQGRIVFWKYEQQEYPMAIFDEDKNIYDIDRPAAWAKLKNQVEVVAQQVKLSDYKVVGQQEETMVLSPGETRIVTISYQGAIYPDVNPRSNIQVSYDADIIFDESGGGYEFFKDHVDLTFQNMGDAPQNVYAIEILAKELEQLPPFSVIVKDPISIQEHGLLSVKVSNDIIQTREQATVIADSVLTEYKDPLIDVIMLTRGDISLKLGDRASVPLANGRAEDYVLTRQKIFWDGALEAEVTAQKIGGM